MTDNIDLTDRTLKLVNSYIKKGWHVFPVHTVSDAGLCSCGKPDCTKAGKHPTGAWSSMASKDPDTVKQWWNYTQQTVWNVGIATGKKSGITVIDIDPGHGGMEAWQKICATYNIPDTYTVRTGSGGYHFYFKYNAAVKTATNTFGPGIDTRNDGGYVVAPPSRHKSGGSYELTEGTTDLADFPPELITMDSPAKSGTKKAGYLSYEKARMLLQFVDNHDYTTWLNVGVILGRAFDRSEEGWKIYQEWSDRDWVGPKGHDRSKLMKESYFKMSVESGSTNHELGVGTLYYYAQQGGYTEIKNGYDINLFCYLASENVFIFLPNGSKWLAAGVDGTVAPVVEFGEAMKASKWLVINRPAVSMISNGEMPNGLISGYFCDEGDVKTLENSVILNLFARAKITPWEFADNDEKDSPITSGFMPDGTPLSIFNPRTEDPTRAGDDTRFNSMKARSDWEDYGDPDYSVPITARRNPAPKIVAQLEENSPIAKMIMNDIYQIGENDDP